MPIVEIDVRAHCVAKDVGRLTASVPGLLDGLSNRQLSVLVLWHFGDFQPPGNAFNRHVLRGLGLLSMHNLLWRGRHGHVLAAFHVRHRERRPDFPKEVARIIATEDNLTREFYEDLKDRAQAVGYLKTARVAGDIVLHKVTGGTELIRNAAKPEPVTSKKVDGRKNNGPKPRPKISLH